MRNGSGAGEPPAPRHAAGVLAEVGFALAIAIVGLVLSLLAAGGRW
ncbi:hypothetical protein [Caldinitratiruptor microaerophilus]|nr:hypothetical protein [Caldinitratiruptor microaerophilus]